MRYDENDRESSNVEDRRGRGRRGGFGFPGGMGERSGGRRIRLPMGGGRGGGFSLTTLLIIGAVMWFLGFNPLSLLGLGGSGGMPDFSQVPQMPQMEANRRPTSNNPFQFPGSERGQTQTAPRPDDDLATFTKQVLADTEDVWKRVFQSFGQRYQEPKLVLFSGSTPTACGTGQSAMGPFYCPLDRKIYIDLQFYSELRRRFKAPGDFAQAYVIAHEVGHHIQLLLGIADRVQTMKQRLPQQQANQVQVRMELQADCISGVWAHLNDQLKNRLEPGDIEEGLNAAAAIGDDMIQRRTTGRVVPEAFTHGSSEQRVRWFKQGFQTGQIQSCDTFNADRL